MRQSILHTLHMRRNSMAAGEPRAAPERVPEWDVPLPNSVRIRGGIQGPLLYVVVLGFVLYLATLPNVLERLDPLTGDEPFYVMTAISLIRDGDLDEANNYARRDYDEFYPPDPLPATFQGWPGFPRDLPPHPATSTLPGLHTKHGIGLSLLIAVPYELFGRVGADLVIVFFAALLAGQMYLLAREAGASTGLAQLIALGLAIAMPIGPYATLIFPEIPAALLLVYAVRRVAAASNSSLQWLAAGAAIGFLPWLHQRFAPTAVVLAIWIAVRLLREGRDRRTGLALAPVAAGGISLLAYNQWLYGQLLQSTEDHAGFNGFTGAVNGAMGLLLDAQWGLFIVAPVMLLATAAVPWWYQASRRTVLVALTAVTPYLIVIAAYKVWWGEWGPAARYLVPVAPFAAGALAAWLARAGSKGRLTAATLWGAGMLLTFVGYLDPQRFYHHPDGVNHLYTRVGDWIRLDLETWLVAFQPYSLSAFPERLWISLFSLTALVLAMNAMGTPVIQRAGSVGRHLVVLGLTPLRFRGREVRVGVIVVAVVVAVILIFGAARVFRSSEEAPAIAVPTGGERVEVSLSRGRLGTTTSQAYRGPVTATVMGTGQAAGGQHSDAFYIFTDDQGNPRVPEHIPDFSLWVNGQPVDAYLAEIPPYQEDHTYTFTLVAPGGPLAFAIGDVSGIDNRGSFDVLVSP